MREATATSVAVFLLACVLANGAFIARSKRSPVPIRAKDEQDLSKVPGRAGIDYPLFRSVPPTNFHCGSVPYAPGIYANVETGCQAYHICHDGREGHQGASFLCPNGTLFNQHEFACDWWYNVNCADATRLYDLNLDPAKNPYFPKKKVEEEPQYEQKYVPQFIQY
ncbi:Chitin Hypothetical protein Peritrophin-A domain [Nesidiocoris tenuis]|uniref:Chitin-binding type-2 domain-containing protein n=1 Tax=Nesidiocoris tenuis TaxID=355587 RepID=A0ABN7ANL8_9HEMI|nr:Chitin Hypothetical protein Peritrophin-A domain [Nesidiocoris tenuis]